ncbi:MAG TPA: SbcC/MukB-like Walker B domain-containing protein [Candidatus Eremiobacteraeota bacterium]|nr:MAG: hypothetical protein BWY64_01731 [bacterium ADurb.Bin363]HPZ07051.1 SbcC/MukB-like Walker B domain-containing protein [Candidatus Eremiobacteraeota bacterium]
MKLLKKLLLINWHSFGKELIEFEGINFLTGINASGKSTIIDAMQLLLLGDTTGHFFNKAANEKSTRTLEGYLYGEIGEDGDTGFKYLRERKRFTSYITCEFHDDVKKSDFTLGIVFDCYEDRTKEHKFFILDNKIPDNEFISNNIPMSYRDLKNFLSNNYKKTSFLFAGTNREYQNNLKGKLGGIKDKYFSLFKKAVSFTPIIDIETFITEYICDVKNSVDISMMQDNIRAYKRLEADANIMEQRISALEKISSKYNAYCEENQRLGIQNYIIKRAKHQEAVDILSKLKEEFIFNNEQITNLTKTQEEHSFKINEFGKKIKELMADKINSDIYSKIKELEKQKKDIEKDLRNLKNNLNKALGKMKDYGNNWKKYINKICKAENGDRDYYFLAELYKEDLANFYELADKALSCSETLLQVDISNFCNMDNNLFMNIRNTLEDFKKEASHIEHSLSKIYKELDKKIVNLQVEINNLKKGVKPYERKLLELRQIISKELTEKYGRTIDVYILADLLEIKESQWRNAIEAYLYKEKFYFFVEPEYFKDAMTVYHTGNFQITGLIDTEKLNSIDHVREPESLAEELLSENKYATLFIDYLTGSLIKCKTSDELRKHQSSITDSCILYQDYTLTQLKTDEWKYPYIGRKSIEEQIRVREDELCKDKEKLPEYNKTIEFVKSIYKMEIINLNEIENILNVIEEACLIPEFEKKLQLISGEIEGIDLTWLEKIDEDITEIEEEIKKLDKRKHEVSEETGKFKKANENINNEKIPEERKKIEEIISVIKNDFSDGWVENTGEPRFKKELEMRSSASEVHSNFNSALARTRSQVELKRNDLVQVRSDYNRDYKMPYDINLTDNNIPYDKELNQIKNIKLPEYKKQIEDAKEKALELFKEDFLAKIKSNIDTIQTQIEELNSALKESCFGSDIYRFTVKPKSEYRNYYNMITDEMLLEGFQLSSHIFQSKYKDSIDELFKQIIDVNIELNADERAELERNIKKFTDYRTYLSFDLTVKDAEDRVQRLSKTLNKKSGGETQTPFYISVLASFAQLYRINDRGDTVNRMRLIIFDEAFSKMDSERIQESVKLLRRFKLQAILSAPPEKLPDITPLVDRTLCVIKGRDSASVKVFDKKITGDNEYEL